MLEFDVLQSGLVILLLLALGDVLTHFTRGAVPAVLFAGLAYMLCCWAGVLPGDLLESSGLGELPAAVMMMVIVNMGASMDISKFVSNWRVALLAVLVFAGQLLALFSVVGGIYGVNTAIGGLPGGMAAALIVQERARALGYEQIITLSVLIMTTQALVGGPAATLCIKKEAARLLASGETLPEKHEDADAEPHGGERRGITLQYGALLKLYAVSWIASRLGMLTGLPRYGGRARGLLDDNAADVHADAAAAAAHIVYRPRSHHAAVSVHRAYAGLLGVYGHRARHEYNDRLPSQYAHLTGRDIQACRGRAQAFAAHERHRRQDGHLRDDKRDFPLDHSRKFSCCINEISTDFICAKNAQIKSKFPLALFR